MTDKPPSFEEKTMKGLLLMEGWFDSRNHKKERDSIHDIIVSFEKTLEDRDEKIDEFYERTEDAIEAQGAAEYELRSYQELVAKLEDIERGVTTLDEVMAEWHRTNS